MKGARRPRYIPPELRTGSEEEKVTRRIWESVGATVYQTSDPGMRRADKGVPDKLIFLPGPRILLAWDDKTGTERYPPTDPRRLSKEQSAFLAAMQRGYTTAGAWGDAEAARQWLLRLALRRREPS